MFGRILFHTRPQVAANDGSELDVRALRRRLAELEQRGRALALFCKIVRRRGGVAVTEESIDLPRLRSTWLQVRDALRAHGAA